MVDSNAMRISLIIPCFDEEDSLQFLLPALDKAHQTLVSAGHEVEGIIVDDGSLDNSRIVLLEATVERNWLRILCLGRNFGQTAAIAAGFAEASGDVLVPMDADMQNDPADIPLLLSKLDEGYDIVSGWRQDRKDKAATRKLPSRVANWLISRVTGVHLHDYGCTLKAYRREVLHNVRLYGEMHRFIPIYAAWRGAKITEIPVQHHPRRQGTTNYGLGRLPNVVLDLMFIRFLWAYGAKPVHAFGKFGIFSIFLSLVVFLIALYFKLWGGKHFVQTPLPTLCAMFFLVGCLSILIGFLAELTTRIYHEAAGRETFVIREVYRKGKREPPPGTDQQKQV